MANTVRVADAIAFFAAHQHKYIAESLIVKGKWNAARIEYEKGLWFRIFGTAFEDTRKGAIYCGMFTERWSFVRLERWAEEIGKIMGELAYHHKLDDERMEWRKDWEYDGWRISMFYAWCSKNGRPM